MRLRTGPDGVGSAANTSPYDGTSSEDAGAEEDKDEDENDDEDEEDSSVGPDPGPEALVTSVELFSFDDALGSVVDPPGSVDVADGADAGAGIGPELALVSSVGMSRSAYCISSCGGAVHTSVLVVSHMIPHFSA